MVDRDPSEPDEAAPYVMRALQTPRCEICDAVATVQIFDRNSAGHGRYCEACGRVELATLLDAFKARKHERRSDRARRFEESTTSELPVPTGLDRKRRRT